MITQVLEYEYQGSAFVLTDKSLIGYSEVNISGIAENRITGLTIYPQPAADVVFVSWDIPIVRLQLFISDLTGKPLFSRVVENGGAVRLGDLQPGVYICTLSDETCTRCTGKLIIN